MSSASTLKAIRLVHNYSGVFFAPAILFFAITGGLQMFGLHETSRGSAYAPPAVLVHLAQLHKKGTLFLAPRRPQPSPAPPSEAQSKPQAGERSAARTEGKPGAPSQEQRAPQPPHNPLPIKIFFALTATGLIVSTITGLIMAWRYARRKAPVVLTLLAGIAVPMLLLLL